MKTPKVSLSIRIRRADGTDSFVEPVWNRNRTLRAGYAVVGGQPEHHPEGIYYLRYKPEGQSRRRTAIGSDPDLATLKLRNMEHDLQAISLGRGLSETTEPLRVIASAEERCIVDAAGVAWVDALIVGYEKITTTMPVERASGPLHRREVHP